MVATDPAVEAILASIPDERREEARRLCALMGEATGEPPAMWGSGIVGFGRYQYRYPSGREGDASLVAFAPRGRQLVIYLVAGYEARYHSALARLGPHKAGKGCLYLESLDDVDQTALRELIDATVREHRSVDTSRR